MKINETIKLVANNLWLYKKEKSYVDFRNALTSVAEEQQEITKQEMIEKAWRLYNMPVCGSWTKESFTKAMEE